MFKWPRFGMICYITVDKQKMVWARHSEVIYDSDFFFFNPVPLYLIHHWNPMDFSSHIISEIHLLLSISITTTTIWVTIISFWDNLWLYSLNYSQHVIFSNHKSDFIYPQPLKTAKQQQQLPVALRMKSTFLSIAYKILPSLAHLSLQAYFRAFLTL